MRVIIVADYAVAEGGAPQVAIASAVALARLGVETTYVQGVAGPADPKLAAAGVQLVALDGRDVWSRSLPSAARAGVWNPEPGRQLASLFAQFDPRDTVVHVHQWTRFFSPSVFAAIRRARLPLVASLHDYFLACPTGLKYRFDLAAPCQLKPLSAGCLLAPCDPRSPAHKAIRVLRSYAARRALKTGAFTAIHVSEVGRRAIGPALPASARQVVLANPVACEDLGPRPPGVRATLVYCGRLTTEKGAEVVAEAARLARLPSLFIGEGPSRARILEIDPKAEVTGWLDRAEMRRRIRDEALAVVAPSLWPESGPLSVPESLASGVPVIVSERAGEAHRVAPGGDGHLVAPRAEAIAAAALAMLAPGIADAMSEAAYRRYWADPPTPEAHARKLLPIYEAAIRG